MPQDAARMNRLQIREQEQLNRERAAQAEAEERRQSEAARRVKSQYDYVRSHGYGTGTAPGPGPGSRSGSLKDDAQIRVYVRECDAEEARSYTYWESAGLAQAAGGEAPGGAARPPAASRAPRKTSSGSGRGSLPSDSAITCDAPNRGRVPRYLQQRKVELAAEKAAIEAEAQRQRELAKIPPGQRLVPEEEKAETLARLDARQAELQTQLGKIPIRFDTQAIRTRRANIEEELREIDSTRLKYSSKKPLYVPL